MVGWWHKTIKSIKSNYTEWVYSYSCKQIQNNFIKKKLPAKAIHVAPASSPWLQSFEPIGLCVQENIDASLPLHWTLSSNMEPLPWPK